MSKTVKKTGNVINFLQKYIHSKYDNKNLVSRLRYEFTDKEVQSVLNRLPRKIVITKLLNNALPRTYSEIRNKRYNSYIHDNIYRELLWYVVSFEYLNKEINQFIVDKSNYEKSFMLGDFEESISILDKIKSEICASVWGIENQFTVIEHYEGVEKNKNFLNSLNEETTDSFVAMLYDLLSKKAEQKMSIYKYKSDLDSYLNKDQYSHNKNIKDYYRYRLDRYAIDDYSELDFNYILFFESNFSIIDRYIMFKNVLYDLVSINRNNNSTKQVLLDLVSRLIIIIDDTDLIGIYNYLSDAPNINSNVDSIKFFCVADYYTTGKFEDVAVLSSEYILSKPSTIEYYMIYLKSLINTNKVIPTSLFPNLIFSILSCFDSLLRKVDNINESYNSLIKMIYSFSSHNWVRYVLYVITNEHNIEHKEHYSLIAYLSSELHNPMLAIAYNDIHKKINYLSALQTIYSSVTIDFWLIYYKSIIEGVPLNLEKVICAEVADKYYGKSLIESSRYDDAINHYSHIIDDTSKYTIASNPHIYESLINGLFTSYVKTGLVHDALILAVSNYMLSPNIIIKMDTKELVLDICAKETVPYSEIALPVMIAVNELEVEDIYIAYDNYLTAMNVEKPLELLKILKSTDIKLVVLFLDIVCNVNVLYKSIFFEGTIEVQNYRIVILQKLLELDINTNNHKKYIEEIETLAKYLVTRKATKQVDENRIYIHLEGVIQSSKDYLEESFERYLDFKSFAIGQIKLIDMRSGPVYSADIPDTGHDKNQTKVNASFSSDPKYLLFKEMFLEFRDRLLFNKLYGLNAYLSARIRHGTLTGQLRSVFQESSLISQKDDSTGKYDENPKWRKIIDTADISDILSYLNDFSIKTDTLLERIKNEYMQIRTELINNAGLFDYSYSESQLLSMFQNKYITITEFHAFLNEIISDLLDKTNMLLENIRFTFTDSILNEVITYLDYLYGQINMCERDLATIQLSNSIVLSRTEIINEIHKVSRWFTISNQSGIDKFDMLLVLNTSIEVIHNIHRISLEPTIKCDVLDIFTGDYFTSFVDIFVILINNIIQHSKHIPSEMKININVSKKCDSILIGVYNNLSNEVDIENISTNIAFIMDDLKRQHDTGKYDTEGKSGYYKIHKIIKYDLKQDKFSIIPKINDKTYQVDIALNMKGITA